MVLSPEAAADLDNIWEYIAEDNLDAPDRFIAVLQDQVLALAATPGMGHRREDLVGDRPLLFWPVGNYLNLYRTTRSTIEVVAFAHGKRDIPAFIERRGI